VRAKAAANVTEDKARAVLARLDVQPVADPLEQLALLAGQVLAWRDVMADQVNALTSIRYEAIGENGSGEQLRAEVALFERALDRCERVLVNIARLDLGAKMARISEAHMVLMERALAAALAESDMDLDAADRARHAFARHLRAV
jgi:predicted Kef-type K+ transport protein